MPSEAHDDADSTTGGGRDHVVPTSNEREKMAEKEKKAVTCLRLVLLAVLVVSAVVVSVVLYLYTSGKEQEEFESQFDSDVFKLMESLGQHLDLTLGSVDAFVYKMVSHAKSSKSEFPFVTVPDFGVQAAKVLSTSVFFYLGSYASVKNDQRLAWENYTADPNNHYWLEENIHQVQVDDPNYHGPIVEDFITSYQLFDWMVNTIPYNDTTDPYSVIWQHYPSSPTPYIPPFNWVADTNPVYRRNIVHARETKTITMAEVSNLVDDPSDEQQVQFADLTNDWAKSYISPDEDPSEPIIELIFPMLNTVDKVQIDLENPDLGPPVGLLFLLGYVRDLIRDILPPNSKGIIIVFKNTYDQVFSYRIDGAETTFLGSGDHHEAKYNHMGRSALLPDLSKENKGKGSSMYTGLPLDTKACVYEVTIYPSQEMQDRYVTSDPTMLAVGAFLIFLFTSAVFLLYDMYVARRQHIIQNRALASGAIVNSLFPEGVRDQLYEEHRPAPEQAKTKNNMLSSVAAMGAISDNASEDPSAMSPASGKPIADLFEETSVFFADIVGFTKWSSSRTPIEVFELLEALYGAFDAIAKRRRVFKVETIGDCYVAVTGLPNPQAEHAVILVKFARDCMTRMRQVLEDLVETLGVDTRELDMRVGIHSGPVTAGVLRGEKGRFQLFGDSVNTAARMESHGKPGMIHVSEATANELTKAGKASWLQPRDEKITAKGKGEMQTYFVIMAPPRTSIISSGESMVLSSATMSSIGESTNQGLRGSLPGRSDSFDDEFQATVEV
ncbi:Receptor-type guanylate cyclase gcy [Seminavis robusta]|uniref:Receptor-type guanylate cyclase gcy n=1 Tax=Seminavis robusta TaxID=568900 RepID=A0A9N8E1D0_9STRA|nr:Receptor-type guanylate cyclase gcy [Seminavis robusta]|eukprot:Sro460_g147560.1 Receptor-type guanylate cyclase gcy (781) ;mRNA; f:40672-43381